VVFCGLVLLWLGVTGRYRTLAAAWRAVRDDNTAGLDGAQLDGMTAGTAPGGTAPGGTTGWDNFKRGMSLQLPKLPRIGAPAAQPSPPFAGGRVRGGGGPQGPALLPAEVLDRLRRMGYPRHVLTDIPGAGK
jgi:hypothetical protein